MNPDLSLWQHFIKSIRPLKKNNIISRDITPKPYVHKSSYIISKQLDLHGVFVQQAYELTHQFITLHYNKQTPKITIITGKGLKDKGKIKNEMRIWLENNDLKDKISKYEWRHDGGCIEIYLKRIKK